MPGSNFSLGRANSTGPADGRAFRRRTSKVTHSRFLRRQET
jgi:hypothetical protein